jgi:hypothetical protein
MTNAPVDTLICDTMQLAAWRQDGAYDYNRELVSTQDTLTEWLQEKFFELLSELLGSEAATTIGRPLLYVLGAIVVGIILWFVYRNHPELFARRRKTTAEEGWEEETIYGIDFDKETQQAVTRGDWRQAVRYTYLKTLRWLSDCHHIDWQPSKTPTQYVYEERHPAFRQLTTHFLRVRYGNFEATEALYEEVKQLSATVNDHWSSQRHTLKERTVNVEKGGAA